MAIVSFWSESKKETGQTLSLIAVATFMSIEHNYKTLIIDATVNDDTINRCFWKIEKERNDIKIELNKGKIDIASGTDGLLSAIASNKTTPEIIANYTKVVFKNRLDVLLGVGATEIKDYEKKLLLYTDLINAANKYYDLIIVDLPKTRNREVVCKILKMSDAVIYTMGQNLKQIEEYMERREEIAQNLSKNIIPLLCNVDINCKYNPKNVASFIKDKNLAFINYNNVFLEATNEAKTANFFTGVRLNRKSYDQNSRFLLSVEDTSNKIVKKFEEIKYGKMMQF